MTYNAPILRGAHTRKRTRARARHICVLRRASCLNSLLSLFISISLALSLSLSFFFARGVAWAFSYLLAPSLRPSRSLVLTPYQRIARRSRLPYYHRRRPSVRYTESPRGSRKAVDCRQPRQTAHRSHALSLVAYSPTGSPTGATSLFDPLLVPSLSLSLAHSLSLSLFLLSVLVSSLPSSSLLSTRHYSIHSVSRRGCGASQLHGARQLRNNNNAVRRCVASCGARHRNATPWIVRSVCRPFRFAGEITC